MIASTVPARTTPHIRGTLIIVSVWGSLCPEGGCGPLAANQKAAAHGTAESVVAVENDVECSKRGDHYGNYNPDHKYRP